MAAEKASRRFVPPPLDLLSGRKCAGRRARRKEVVFPVALNQLGL
jgi:hypothetical protein